MNKLKLILLSLTVVIANAGAFYFRPFGLSPFAPYDPYHEGFARHVQSYYDLLPPARFHYPEPIKEKSSTTGTSRLRSSTKPTAVTDDNTQTVRKIFLQKSFTKPHLPGIK